MARIGIIGAGFTGLSAAYFLLEHGHDVRVFEKDREPGGLAIGYQEQGWQWSLEHHYHHWFTNDNAILALAQHINYPVRTIRPKTSVYVNDRIYQLDSPLKLLQFPRLSVGERLRMATTLALLRYNPFWQPLEKFHATTVLPRLMGKRAYTMLWEPQLKNKFGEYVPEMSLAWFWARIKKRTASLAYPEGGFLRFAQTLVSEIEKIAQAPSRVVQFQQELVRITSDRQAVSITTRDRTGKETTEQFAQALVTLPSFLFGKTAPDLPESYRKKLGMVKGLGATNVLLRLKKPFFADHTYWLSVCDTTSPVMAIVEHTNFIPKKYYNGEHLIYLGNYLPTTDPNFQKSKAELLARYDPFLVRINPEYKKNLIDYEVFKAPFAQPIIPTNYSRLRLPFTTPLANVYLANMEQVYPWDRGTNYAVELGKKVARRMSTS